MFHLEFTCDRLNDSCKANQSAKDICANAQTAAAAAAAKTGAQADVFNAAFGIKTVRFYLNTYLAFIRLTWCVAIRQCSCGRRPRKCYCWDWEYRDDPQPTKHNARCRC